MTVYELCELFSDSAVISVYSFEQEKEIYNGYSDEIPDEIGEKEIASIDPVFPESHHLTINID